MTFGEKIRKERLRLGLTQGQLAKLVGVTLRVISSYETNSARPRGLQRYEKLAEVLNVDVNYLLAEGDAFIVTAEDKYGTKGAKQAKALVNEISGLFAGGNLADEDLDVMMRAIQDAYWVAKERNRKFTPHKYRSE